MNKFRIELTYSGCCTDRRREVAMSRARLPDSLQRHFRSKVLRSKCYYGDYFILFKFYFFVGLLIEKF